MRTFHFTFIAVMSFAFANCSQEEKPSAERRPVPVKVVKITLTEPERTEQYSGTVEEAGSSPLSFAVGGTIRHILVKLGDSVTRGQLLAELDPASMQHSNDVAQAALLQAEDAYRRMKELHEKGSLADMKWVEAQSRLQQAESMAELARKNLEDCRLYAPFSGTISQKFGDVGENVLPGNPVVRLVTAQDLKVKIAVPESEIAGISVGQRAFIRSAAFGDQVWEGSVVEKGIVANPFSRSYEVKIQVNPTAKELLPGMVVRVNLTEEKGNTSAVIPANIVLLDEQNRTFVWLNSQGYAQKRYIECDGFTANGVIVSSGLEPGEEVISEGYQKVSENMSLKIQ